MDMFVLTVLYIGQSMSSDKSLKETLETNNKKPWVETTQGFFLYFYTNNLQVLNICIYFNDNKNVFGIPPFMFVNNGYTVSNVNQIEFTERNFDIWKGEVVQEEAYNAANKAKEFDYKVTSKSEDLTVEKTTE